MLPNEKLWLECDACGQPTPELLDFCMVCGTPDPGAELTRKVLWTVFFGLALVFLMGG